MHLWPLVLGVDFMPHGHCYFWRPDVIALHVVSDGLISLAYLSIPLTLVAFVRRRADLPFKWVFWAFGTFIVSCGLTHLMEIWTLWNPNYFLSGGLKAFTAVISVITAVMLARLIPEALKLPSPRALREANAELSKTTEQYRLALAQLELQRLALQHMKKGLTLVRQRDGLIVFANPWFEAMLGYAPGALLELPATTLTREPLPAIGERAEVSVEVTLVGREGQPIFCRASTVAFDHPDHGRVWATHYQERNDEMRGLMADIVSSTSEAAVAVSPDGLVQTWNRGAEHLYGHTAAEAMGVSFATLTGGTFTSPAAGGSLVLEVQHRSKTAAVLDVVVTASSICDQQGKPVAVSMLIHDVSARMQAERALANSLHEKDALLKEVHHRVKNNLQVVASLLNLQRDALAHEEARDALRAAHARVHAIAHLHELIYQSESLSLVSLEDYLRDLVSSVSRAHHVGDRELKLAVSAPGLEVGLEQGVPLTLLLNELLSNVFKHAFPESHPGPLSLTLEGRRVEGEYELTLSDSGRGLPEGFAIERSRGLGLQLVRSLARQLTGRLSHQSAGGTRWTLRFPMAVQT